MAFAPRTSRGRWSTRAMLALLVATAGIGLLHTSWGRPLLMRLGGCPAARVSAAEVERLRLTGFHAVALPGSLRAPARPALGFALEETTPADVRAWAARAGIQCEARERGLLSLRCRQVPRDRLPGVARAGAGGGAGAGAPPIDELALTFAPSGRLISVDAFTPGLPPGDAAASYRAATAGLQAWLGPPADEIGAGAAALASAPLATARARFRFDDYVAIVSASNLSSGVAVREQYLTGG
jgi:hypothetical protein